jgi:hypothetical protein
MGGIRRFEKPSGPLSASRADFLGRDRTFSIPAAAMQILKDVDAGKKSSC